MGSDSCRLFGRNLDWTNHIALLLFTHPSDGYASISMVHLDPLGYSEGDPVDSPGNRRAFLMSPTTPLDGMNECGVAIGMMLVDHADPPYDPEKVTLHSGLVIRLVLDYAKNTEEAVELLGNYNVDFGDYPSHIRCDGPFGNHRIPE
jgi:choloylglycine hydrolase